MQRLEVTGRKGHEHEHAGTAESNDCATSSIAESYGASRHLPHSRAATHMPRPAAMWSYRVPFVSAIGVGFAHSPRLYLLYLHETIGASLHRASGTVHARFPGLLQVIAELLQP